MAAGAARERLVAQPQLAYSGEPAEEANRDRLPGGSSPTDRGARRRAARSM
jgi:hypothetical protein